MVSRRTFVSSGASAAAFAASSPRKLKIAVFSKHLQFLQGDELAEAVASMGFDGIDLALRKGGHLAPEQAASELPKLLKIVKARGIEMPMITSDIVDADSPHAESVLKTIADLGIRHYRWGGFRYKRAEPVAQQLAALKPRVAKLEALNKKYGVCAMYHTHSGIGQVGASIWDLYFVLKDFDPAAVAVNYDVAHATIEGGLGGWVNSFGITGKYMKGVAIKDFLWSRKGATKDGDPNWDAEWTPIGQGMVKFGEFYRMLAQSGFDGPIQAHFEYPLGGAEHGNTSISISKNEVLAAMKKDLKRIREQMSAASLT